MCGIFSVINKNLKPLDIKKCRDALKLMKKRGPDWSVDKVINNYSYLGQVVLSMTGDKKKKYLSNYSKSNNFFLLLVGEIYNYQELNNLNLFFKHDFSDTEILANLFEKIPKNKINSILDGMYSYLLFDKYKNTLNLSRDPNGEKTLYKYEDNEKIIISSEIKPIIYYQGSAKLNFDTLKNYFLTRHFIEHKKTIYNNIEKIERGLNIEIDLFSFKKKIVDKIEIRDLISKQIYTKNNKKHINEIVDELDFLLDKNIKQMIPKNRNVASIISGGIDSSIVSKYLCKYVKNVYLINLDHINKDFNSKKVSQFEKYLNNKVNIHSVTKHEYFKNYLKCLKICHTPINSHSFVGNYINAKIANNNNCRAIFGGEGADELFGGYSTYLDKPKLNINHSDYTKILKYNFFNFTKEQLDFIKIMKSLWHNNNNSYNFLKNLNERKIQSMMLMDATSQMESNAFKAGDLMSMNNSVESRNLFFRKDIVRFAVNLPLKFKINLNAKNNMKNKYVLKKLFIKKFKEKLIFVKQGFPGFPNETQDYIGALDKFLLNRFINFSKLKHLYNSNKSLQWKILNTEFYLKEIGYKYL